MATWSLSPQYKKSAVEKMFFFKDGKIITIEQGYRWATFKMESDICPLSTTELKNDDGYELDGDWEMWDMVDGCWLDIESYRDATEKEVEEFTNAWEEDFFEGVEALGWSQDECEYYYHGPLSLTNEDTGEEFLGEPDSNPVTPEAIDKFIDDHVNFIENMTDEEWEDLGKEEPVVTDWYPVSTNPVRDGTYQILETELEVSWPFESNVKAGIWNGKKWDNKRVVKWRGLTSDPETK